MSAANCCMHRPSLACRSLRDCNERCGVVPAGAPEAQPPAPPITEREPVIGPWGALAIAGFVVSFGLPLVALARMLP